MRQIAFIFNKQETLYHYLTFVDDDFTPNVIMLDHFYGFGKWIYIPTEQLPEDLTLCTIIDGALTNK